MKYEVEIKEIRSVYKYEVTLYALPRGKRGNFYEPYLDHEYASTLLGARLTAWWMLRKQKKEDAKPAPRTYQIRR